MVPQRPDMEDLIQREGYYHIVPAERWSLWVEFEADGPDGSPTARGNWTQVLRFASQTACLRDKQQRLEAADQVHAPGVTYERQGDRFTTIVLGPSPDRSLRSQWTLWYLPADVNPLHPPAP